MEMHIPVDALYKKDSPKTVGMCIAESREEAVRFISHSRFIEEKMREGCKNNSRESTMEGTLEITETISEKIAGRKMSSPEVALFGEHLREAYNIIKSVFHK